MALLYKFPRILPRGFQFFCVCLWQAITAPQPTNKLSGEGWNNCRRKVSTVTTQDLHAFRAKSGPWEDHTTTSADEFLALIPKSKAIGAQTGPRKHPSTSQQAQSELPKANFPDVQICRSLLPQTALQSGMNTLLLMLSFSFKAENSPNSQKTPAKGGIHWIQLCTISAVSSASALTIPCIVHYVIIYIYMHVIVCVYIYTHICVCNGHMMTCAYTVRFELREEKG